MHAYASRQGSLHSAHLYIPIHLLSATFIDFRQESQADAESHNPIPCSQKPMQIYVNADTLSFQEGLKKYCHQYLARFCHIFIPKPY